MAVEWAQASALANVLMALMTGLLAVVTWVQAKQLAYKDLVAHYHEMASKVYPEVEKNLKVFSDPGNVLCGQGNMYIGGGGPVGEWWPALKLGQPGLVPQLPRNLQERMKEFQALAAKSDQERNPTYKLVWETFSKHCEPICQKLGIKPEMPAVEAVPAGAGAGPSVHELWARGESIEQWLDRTADHRGGTPGGVQITVASKVIANDAELARCCGRSWTT
jgi:hypothetical protein